MTRRLIAFATYARHPAATDDDAVLVRALEGRGAAVHALPWDDGGADWRMYDAVVIRSTWDYHLRQGEFLAWIGDLERAGVPVWNPPALVRWNADKRYLRALAQRGAAVVPTAWSDEEGARTLGDIRRARRWPGTVVVKPAVSASAHGTWRSTDPPDDADERRFAADRAARSLLVQPLLPEVAADGEWSIVFVAGQASHAVVKRPAPGDFRVQAEHGGSASPAEPPASLLADARAALEGAAACVGIAPASVLYARVDGVSRGGRLVLMELECIEPALYFEADRAAAERVAAALLERVSRPPVTDADGRASRQGHASARQ